MFVMNVIEIDVIRVIRSLLPNSKLPVLFGGRKSDYKMKSDMTQLRRDGQQ